MQNENEYRTDLPYVCQKHLPPSKVRMLTRSFATPSLASARKPRATQRLANSAVITCVFLLVAERWTTLILHGGGREIAKMRHDPTPRCDLSPRFDCAIDWVRVPKTASTSVWMAFMNPLVITKLFMPTYLMENSCIEGAGGCAAIWNMSSGHSFIDRNGTVSENTPPYYGIDTMTDRRKMSYTRADLGRCFPREGVELYCYEYDGRTKTMNFGPPSKMQKTLRNRLGIKLEEAKPSPQVEKTSSMAMSNENRTYFIHPSVQSHVGLDTSIFGWLLPHNPIIFSMFRDPLERLLSSFHHGIRYGANRPGSVKLCVWDKERQKNVAEARRLALVYNDTTSYQKMLREYLQRCPDATKNVYTQFFDPLTKNLSVALDHLDKHRVVVGLQDKVEESLQRWINATLGACSDRPDYSRLRGTLTESFKVHGGTKANVRTKVAESVTLSPPNISAYDKELRDLLRAYTHEDEVIYKRARELYDEQGALYG